jgi:cation diffusion facilitator CzcD-associated flavoprotein CzcO
LTPGIGYLEALVEDNVQVVTTPIKAFTETGLEMEDGEKRDYDAVICATGFNVSHVPRKTVPRLPPCPDS